MTPRPAVFLSHTTRYKRDFALAHKLASALRLRGAEAPPVAPAAAVAAIARTAIDISTKWAWP